MPVLAREGTVPCYRPVDEKASFPGEEGEVEGHQPPEEAEEAEEEEAYLGSRSLSVSRRGLVCIHGPGGRGVRPLGSADAGLSE